LVNIATVHFDLFSLQIHIVIWDDLLVDILPTTSYKTIFYTNLAIYCQVQSNLTDLAEEYFGSLSRLFLFQ